MQEMQQGELLKQAGQLAGTPMMDPSKNPAVGRLMNDGYDQLNPNANNQGEQAPTGQEEAPPQGQ